MRLKHNFDMVCGTQEVFRLLLDALANPGKTMDLSAQISQFAANGMWLAPSLTLLDNEASFYWDGSEETGEEIRFLSGAAQVPLKNADFIFLSLKDTPINAEQILSQVKTGTHRDPHDSGLIFIASEGKADQVLSLKGPGIPPEGRNVSVSDFEAMWIKARDRQAFEYPCGVDLIFLREDYYFFAVTRKTVIKWPM